MLRQASAAPAIANAPNGVFGDAAFTGHSSFDANMTQVLNASNSGGHAGSGAGVSMLMFVARLLFQNQRIKLMPSSDAGAIGCLQRC